MTIRWACLLPEPGWWKQDRSIGNPGRANATLLLGHGRARYPTTGFPPLPVAYTVGTKPLRGSGQGVTMYAKIVDHPSRQHLLFRHRPPWCWWRLRELHLVATGQRPAVFQVLDPSIKDVYAPLAYENAAGASMAVQALLNHRNLDALMNDLADFLESVGIDGLEPLLLSGLFGLEGINLTRPGRTSTLDRLSQILRNSPVPAPIAGGLAAFPVVDRNRSRVHFYRSDDISQLLSDVGPWLSGVDAGMGGLGGFGYGTGGPIFNSFKSRLDQVSAQTDVSRAFCQALGVTAGIGVNLQSIGLGVLVFGLVGGLAGGEFGPGGAALGGAAGAFVGGVVGWQIGEGLNDLFETEEVVTQTCDGAFAEDPEDDPQVTDTDEEEMPNPTSEETGLTPTDIQIAIAVARLNAAKRVDPNQTIMASGEPVVVSSPETRRRVLIQPSYDPAIERRQTPVILGPRPGGPLIGRRANSLSAGASSVHVALARESAPLTFSRVRAGEYAVTADLR